MLDVDPGARIKCWVTNTSAFSEMWDYSWRNIDGCSGTVGGPVQRFVPPGATYASPRPLNRQWGDDTLVFMGNVFTHSRQQCWPRLRSMFPGESVVTVTNVWNNKDLTSLLQNHTLFLVRRSRIRVRTSALRPWSERKTGAPP